MSYDNYRELAKQTLYSSPSRDDEERQKMIETGQGWATLALAAAIHELAEAHAQRPG